MSALKLQVKQSDFYALVSQAYGLIEKRSIMPILSKVLISAKKNSLHIQATDQDNSLQSQISAQVKEEGQIVVDAQSLFDILKELDDTELLVHSDSKGKKIQLKQRKCEFHLTGLAVQDFPVFPPFKMKNFFLMGAGELKQLIDKTFYCSSLDDTRYHLTGVFFESSGKNGKTLRFVATDGHRLGLAQCSGKDKVLEKGVIIPKKGIVEIKKLLSSSEEESVKVAVEGPRILFQQKHIVLSIKLVEGSFPHYQPFIPKEKPVTLLKINTTMFSQALKRVSLLSNTRFKGVTFHIKGNKIAMEAEHPELGSAHNEVECLDKKGPDLSIRFNARYVLEALNHLDGEEAELELKNKVSPCLIRPVTKKEASFSSLGVVMPMQI